MLATTFAGRGVGGANGPGSDGLVAARSVDSGPVDGASPPRRLDAAVVAVSAVALCGLVLRLVLVTRPIAVIDRLFVPDDTYYTLTIARSLADGLGPTVDGSTLTSGFQPLLGFLMVPVFRLTDSADAALRVDLVLLVLVDTLTIGVLAWVAWRLAGRVAAVVAAAIWAVSPVAISMALGGLETSLAIFFQVGLVASWIHAASRDDRRSWIVVGAVAGFAVLARIDALALVAILAAIQLWRGPRRRLGVAALACTVVLGPWWLWCTITFGTPIPTSGAAVHELAPFGSFTSETMTLAASAVVGGPFGLWDRARSEFVGHWVRGAVIFWVFVVALVGLALVWLRVSFRSGSPAWRVAPAIPTFAACLLVFYAWFGVTWFFTRYLAPVAWIVTIVVAVAIGSLARWAASASSRPAPRRAWPRTLVPILGLAVVAVLLLAAVRADIDSISAEGRTPVAAGTGASHDALTGYRGPVRRVLRDVPRGSRIAGWQSGALGYYGIDRTVINLDGAVNPDIAGADDARLARYLEERRVEGFADFDLVVFRLGTTLSSLGSPGRTELVTTVPASGVLPPYTYSRLI
ncbi:MAG: hypothetical protein ACXW2C_11970, partial [Acidimicrobiia bacterium]